MTLLAVKDLTVSLRSGQQSAPIVDGLSLQIEAGQCLGIVGESGSGKSTVALAVMGLLVAYLFLPIPATPVMSAAGFLYGTLVGGIISAAGSFAAGMAGYGLCRAFGRGIAVRLAGEQELTQHETLFHRSGPWLVAASRWLPLLPEVISCLAGLTRMPLRIFAVSLACGAVPMGFVFAAIGASGREQPGLALTLSVLVPPVLWLAVRPLLRSRNVEK